MGNMCGGGSEVENEEALGFMTPEGAIKFEFEGKNISETFKLGRTLGEGAYSQVKEGTHIPSNKLFAVKCIKKDKLPPEDEADLLEEVNILRNLEHPNIIEIYQFYKYEKDYYYVIIEYMKGGELFDRIVAKQFYTEKEARDLCKVLLEAVKYLHDKDIVHRDLKPENLLMTSSNDDASIKLADFGFAKSLNGQTVSTQCGTPAYVAPEILRNKPYGTSVDMWSIGVIIYILLGGYPPFHDEKQARLFRKIRAGSYKFHPEYWAGISSEAKDLISRLLTVDVNKRLTATGAVLHPWILSKDSELEGNNLGKNLEAMRLFNARRKLRGAIKAIIMAKMVGRIGNMKMTKHQ